MHPTAYQTGYDDGLNRRDRNPERYDYYKRQQTVYNHGYSEGARERRLAVDEQRKSDEVGYDQSDDEVTHPSHYTSGSIEVWDFILDQFGPDFLLANVIKYVCRAGKKKSSTLLKDLHKARAYLNKVIDYFEKQESNNA